MTISVKDISLAPLEELFAETRRLRQERFGDRVELCAIVNVKSGQCPMDCRFCAQSGHYETAAAVYPLLETETMIAESRNLWRQGVHRVGWVASGCSVGEKDIATIADAASNTVGVAAEQGRLCASLGQLGKKSLKKLRSSGVSRYHHNLESSESFYSKICTTQRWSDRRKTVERAKESGLETCSGGLFGLGETWQDRIDLAETLRELDVDSAPINFFNPISGTPLGDRTPLTTDEALRIIVLFRLILPTTSLRICGGRPMALGDRWPELFDAGAEALMTGNYLTTSGYSVESDQEAVRRMKIGRDGSEDVALETR